MQKLPTRIRHVCSEPHCSGTGNAKRHRKGGRITRLNRIADRIANRVVCHGLEAKLFPVGRTRFCRVGRQQTVAAKRIIEEGSANATKAYLKSLLVGWQ